MKISVILVDNHGDYIWVLGNRLAENDIALIGRFSHSTFIQHELIELPDIAIVAFDNDIVDTQETSRFINEKYPSIKILVNSTAHDMQVVDALSTMQIHGLIFNALDNLKELRAAINIIYRNGKYFM